MIGSHNTFSYLPTKKWWMKLLTPWHKCQQWKFENQIQLANVGYIDIRVRFDKDDEPVLVHNNVVYETPIEVSSYILGELSSVNPKKPIPCRLMLDVRKKPKNADHQTMLFKELIKDWETDKYLKKYLTIDEARIYWDWQHPLIKSKYRIIEVHTSVCSPWHKYILGTKWFAKKYNSYTIVDESQITSNIVYLIDYVNIREI